jgi:hypothetical protein
VNSVPPKDVIVENTTVLPAHDIQYEVGRFAADDYRFLLKSRTAVWMFAWFLALEVATR